MIPIHKFIGRLSNQMFLTAAHYTWTRDSNIHFFVQDEKYFKKFEHEIRQMFGTGINFDDRISIHVRLTDYIGNTFYTDLGHHKHKKIEENYYMRAIAMFPGERFLVFSDDIEQAKKMPMFQGKQFDFSEGRDAVEDMNLMASCKSNIIANSSFSWWAAWLNPNPNKVVIAPKQWFSDLNNEQFIGIPETWKRI